MCFFPQQSHIQLMPEISFNVQAKQLLKKLNPRSTAKMSIESNPYVFQ